MQKQVRAKIEQKLAKLSKEVLEQYKPEIVSITGSVGKTSTKEAIKAVLSSQYSVRANKYNYNTEIGLPLTILDELSPERDIFGWWKIFRRAKKLARGGAEYPQILVLEMGMDRPGDLAKLVKIAKPDIAVVTNVSGSHQEYFGSLEAIAEEKSTLVKALSADGVAVLNADNKIASDMQKLHKGKTIFYGEGASAQVRASNVQPVYQLDHLPESSINTDELLQLQQTGAPMGVSFDIEQAGQKISVVLPRVLGAAHVQAALAGAAVGLIKGLGLSDVAKGLTNYHPVPGRLNLIAGIKDTALIDDTYNASPVSTLAALDALESVQTMGRKIAVLGDMAELGTATEAGHQEVGERTAHVADFAVFVGPKMQFAAGAAEAAGLVDERQTHVQDSRQVESVLQSVVREGDIVLIKGSRMMKMEIVTKNLMAHPERADQLLVS